ncbi:MAG: alpha/beta hydrolase, partial [Sporichthyaceae bacterium]|nr:alpha/beta hydrolase [Sporichthyaceae bacterium]
HDPRIGAYLERSGAIVYSPDVLRHFATVGYGELDAAGALARVRHPVLVLAGRYDRVATAVAAAEAVAVADQDVIELLVLERSGHMTFVEEQEHYLDVVREFLTRTCL